MKTKLAAKGKTTESTETIEMEIVSEVSEEEEDDDEDEEEDEVFIKSGGQHENGSAKKPLIKKRKSKQKKNGHGGGNSSGNLPADSDTEIREGKPTAKRCCGPICCLLMGIKTLLGLVALTVVLTNYFTHAGWLFFNFGISGKEGSGPNLVGCHDLEVIPIWQVKFPKLIVESSTRLIRVNEDDIPDVVLGFGTGADGYDIPEFVCDIYFDGQKPCLGGILALDGKTGVEIWRLWTKHEIFALTCQADLDGDGVMDCLAGGRAGVFLAVSLKEGKELWSFGEHAILSDLMSVYAAQFIEDIDNDGVQDVLAVHGGDALADPNPQEHMFGRLILFSGQTGRLLQWMPTPDGRESYYPPQVSTGPDGRQIIIMGTGSSKRGGALYAKPLLDLYRKNVTNIRRIYKDDEQGILNPAALVDINHDGIQDIVLASMNSRVLAFDGLTFGQIWNTTIPGHQSASSLAVGLWDNDDVPDVMVKYNYGDEFPVYEYEKTVVLSGLNGSIISSAMVNSVPAQSTPITISLEGQGNDLFLHWMINCKGRTVGESLKYGFRSGTHLYEKSQADLCQALFAANQEAKFTAIGRHLSAGSVSVYNSSDWATFEHKDAVNTSAVAQQYLARHPELQEDSRLAEDGASEYSVLPYRRKDFEAYLKLLQEENEREFNGQLPVIDPGTMMYSDNGVDYDMAENESEDQNNPAPAPPGQPQLTYPAGSKRQQQPLYPLYPGQPLPPQYPPFVSKQKRGHDRNQEDAWLDILRQHRRRRREAVGTRSEYQGIHRQAATGSLAPPLIAANDTIDVVLPTYWVYPPRLDILQPEDIRCVEKELRRLNQQADKNDDGGKNQR
jgi:outer membrane protein assembly factor BamB